MTRNNSYGFLLDAIPGLLGLFGFGELYLGKKRRGEFFLAGTVVLYMMVAAAFALPSLSYYWGISSIAWATGYILLLISIIGLTRRRQQGP